MRTDFGVLLAEFVEAPVDELAARSLAEYLRGWSESELDVLGFVAGRLALGRARYGPLDLTRDTRSWRLETSEELGDVLVYSACEALARNQGRGVRAVPLARYTGSEPA